MKLKRHVHPIFFKSVINKKIGHVRKAIQSEELEINNKMTTCADKYKQTSSAYDIKGVENTSSTSEKK